MDGEFLYEQVADRITHLIENGTIRPGERIPSVRRLSRDAKVSISTVLGAYDLLENRGWIEARPKSGFYARANPRQLPPEPEPTASAGVSAPATQGELTARVLQLTRRGGIVPLGAAIPAPEIFPTAALHRTQSALVRRLGPRLHSYDVSPGNQELIRQIARRAPDAGITIPTKEITVTSGCTEALSLALRSVTSTGDVVAVETPTYFGILSLLHSLGLRVLEVGMHPREGIELSALSTALRKRKVAACVLQPNFQNPTGSCMPDEKKKELVDMLTAREVPLIEDDIYGELAFGSARAHAAKSFDRKGFVMWCSSFTKVLCPGYRLGWIAAGRFHQQVERLKLATSMGTSAIPQMVVAEFLQNTAYDRYLRRVRAAYQTQIERMTWAISKYFPEGTRLTRPSGGFMLWVDIPGVDSVELFQKALRNNISIAPGPMFTNENGCRSFLRLNCGQLWSDELDRALLTLGRLAESCR